MTFEPEEGYAVAVPYQWDGADPTHFVTISRFGPSASRHEAINTVLTYWCEEHPGSGHGYGFAKESRAACWKKLRTKGFRTVKIRLEVIS